MFVDNKSNENSLKLEVFSLVFKQNPKIWPSFGFLTRGAVLNQMILRVPVPLQVQIYRKVLFGQAQRQAIVKVAL